MFCPDCGTANGKGQKFCTGCGTSLLAVEYGRTIINEMATTQPTSDLSASSVLKTTAVVSLLGLFFITVGTIIISLIYQDHHGPPVGMFFGMAGLAALVIIVRHLLKLIDRATKPQPRSFPLSVNPTSTPTNMSNRKLTEGNQPYYSVTEERTKELENR